MNFAGIDISYKIGALVIKYSEQPGKPHTFDNTPPSRTALVNALHKAQVKRVGLEATGTYHLDLAIALDDAGLEVMVVNPKVAKDFSGAMPARSKTDAIDAALLAEFVQRMPFKPWSRPNDQALAIRACARRLTALNKPARRPRISSMPPGRLRRCRTFF